MFTAEYEPAQSGSRRRSRAPVPLEEGIGRGGIDRTLCKVTGLSVHGVRLQTYSPLKPGVLLWLTLPGTPPRAVRVLRADDFEAGCEFVDTLSNSDFERLVELGR
ncbi:PilZ domain-containing protein [Sphingomonas sp. CFBP 13720]|uniref:PilZ domain-containing protein n=1 Tax=Sphingomonas sp. CFBP 13720 TaxID=2775302 RepID=UPI0017801599|nr:PilZ domain-containing protein [Sphingomonas sp. CFBP 13720]MBD8679558.1 PilZ domain-containing protein [Sphingomonas sp. CFBP 13720]